MCSDPSNGYRASVQSAATRCERLQSERLQSERLTNVCPTRTPPLLRRVLGGEISSR